MTTITWPIDMHAEQQALRQRGDDDESGALATLQILQRALVSYKSAFLRVRSRETKGGKRSALSSIMIFVLLPSLSKPRHQRTERDIGIINMCLHLFRNLLAVNDPMATSLSSLDVIADSKLQSDLVVELSTTGILDTILMLASNADSKDFNSWNVVASDCVYYIFAGTRPEELIGSKREYVQNKAVASTSKNPEPTDLERYLAAEKRHQAESTRFSGSSRHSRFNTMINFVDKSGNIRMAKGQAALTKSVDQLTLEADAKGKRQISRRKGLEEKGAASRRAPWTTEARKVLATWADKFLLVGYESLTRSVLEDIRKERPKVGDLDMGRTRIMQLGHFFLEYFLIKRRTCQAQQEAQDNHVDIVREGVEVKEKWPFSLVSQWTEPWALRMAYVRCSSSFEKKHMLEYVAAIQLWTSLFNLIDALSKSQLEKDKDVAEGMLSGHFYDQAAIDSAKAVLSSYTTQSFRCLRSIIALAQIMPRMLERYSKDKTHMYVKAKQQVRKAKTGNESLAEEEMQAQNIAKHEQTERKFEFDKFQSKMCSNSLADACLSYLQRWQEFQDHPNEQLYNVTQVLHRLVIKAGDLRLFFPHKRRAIVKALQTDRSFWTFVKTAAPNEEGDLHKLIEYILRKFDKLSEDEQARWAEGMGMPKPVKIFKMPAEIEIRPSRGHMDDLGIAVGLMVEKDKLSSVMWIKSGLEEAVRVKKTIIEEERENDPYEDADDDSIPNGALRRFADFELDYNGDDEKRAEASTAPEFKLLCRLLGLKSDESDDHRWIWTVPADALPQELEKEVELIEDFIRRPHETFGETYSSMVQRVRKVANKPIRTIINEFGDEEEVSIRKVKPRRKEKAPKFIDEDLIEDSDEELAQVARLIAEREKNDNVDQDDEDHSSSSRGKSMSDTAGSSPPSSHRGDIEANKKKAQNALFFDSEEEELDSDTEALVNEQINELVGSDIEPRPKNSKRSHVLSSEDESEASENEKAHTQIRKRRALIDDSDDDN
jgi:replication fork protection complex subunit Tof1/Swi1